MEDIVKKLIKKYKTNDPFIIARKMNIEVWFRDLGSSTRGVYVRKLRRRYIIIHENLDEHWARFICAHELGHDRIHPGINRFSLDENSLYNAGKYERQANKFAIELLTITEPIQQHESIYQFFCRHNIPHEMINCYK